MTKYSAVCPKCWNKGVDLRFITFRQQVDYVFRLDPATGEVQPYAQDTWEDVVQGDKWPDIQDGAQVQCDRCGFKAPLAAFRRPYSYERTPPQDPRPH